jgi:hypothetical protein
MRPAGTAGVSIKSMTARLYEFPAPPIAREGGRLLIIGRVQVDEVHRDGPPKAAPPHGPHDDGANIDGKKGSDSNA